MPLVQVENIGLKTCSHQRPEPSNPENHLLLEPILPVAAIEVVRYSTVFLSVTLKIGIEQVERYAPHHYHPYPDSYDPSGESYFHRKPVTLSIAHRLGGSLRKVLVVILRYLLPTYGEALGEVAVSIEEPDGCKVHIAIRGLLQVVARQHAKPSRVELKRGVQPVLHAEVAYGRGSLLLRGSHVGIELRLHFCQAMYKLGVL